MDFTAGQLETVPRFTKTKCSLDRIPVNCRANDGFDFNGSLRWKPSLRPPYQDKGNPPGRLDASTAPATLIVPNKGWIDVPDMHTQRGRGGETKNEKHDEDYDDMVLSTGSRCYL